MYIISIVKNLFNGLENNIWFAYCLNLKILFVQLNKRFFSDYEESCSMYSHKKIRHLGKIM